MIETKFRKVVKDHHDRIAIEFPYLMVCPLRYSGGR